MKLSAQWGDWNGQEFVANPDIEVLEVKDTPRMLNVILPRGQVIRLKRFGRFDQPVTSWRHWWRNRDTSGYIDFKIVDPADAAGTEDR